MSIRSRYESDLEALKLNVVKLGADAERMVAEVYQALAERDAEKAGKIIKDNRELAAFEALVEQQCFHLLLRQHPVARDFREVSAALKIITDLERVGHQCSDVAELVEGFRGAAGESPARISEMAHLAAGMVRDAVDAYVRCDGELAREVFSRDDALDEAFLAVTQELVARIKEEGADADRCVLLMMVAKYFERMGDHAAHMADWVAYGRTGKHLRAKYGETLEE